MRPVPSPAAPSAAQVEFERLAQRAPSAAEQDALDYALHGRDGARALWVEGLRPEAAAFLAATLPALGLRCLFVSPFAALLEARQHRLGRRAAVAPVAAAPRGRRARAAAAPPCRSPLTLWCELSEAARALPGAPDVIFLEGAEGLAGGTLSYRPGFAELAEALAAASGARVVLVAAPGHEKARAAWQARLGGPVERTLEPLPELRLEVRPLPRRGREVDVARLAPELAALPRPLLVLAATPALADALYAELLAEQVPVHRYHAAMPRAERAAELVRFALPGRRAVMVATSAFGPAAALTPASGRLPEDFGRGYARGDLRSLAHVGPPSSLAQYTAELALLHPAGLTRAPAEDDAEGGPPEPSLGEPPEELGLSEGPPRATLFYDAEELHGSLQLLERRRPEAQTLAALVAHLATRPKEVPASGGDLSAALGAPPRALAVALDLLVEAGGVERAGEGFRALRGAGALTRAATRLGAALRELEPEDEAQLSAVAHFAEGDGCRRRTLEALLDARAGAEFALPDGAGHDAVEQTLVACGLCDHCAPAAAAPETAPKVLRRRAQVRAGERSDGFELEPSVARPA